MAIRMFEDNPVAAKLFIIAGIALGLMIPLSMLRGLITERAMMRDQAVATVANGWGGGLTAGGPLLRIPFDVLRHAANGETLIETHQLYALADDLDVHAILVNDKPRSVGIYQVPVYLVRVKLSGHFKLKEMFAAATVGGPGAAATYHWNEARLRLPLSDVRSMREFDTASLAGVALEFGPAPAAGSPAGDFSGVEAKVDLSRFSGESSLPFAMELLLAGSQSLAFLPTAAHTQAALQADWPDPQFQGAFLPSKHQIDARGFSARWQVLALNRDFAQTWVDKEVDAAKMSSARFGVGLFQSVDVYQRSERAVKYALLFISLTFLTFFAWELLGHARVHAVQYLFIGLALSTFYLLLIARSEHLAFWLSYWLGAAALAAAMLATRKFRWDSPAES